MSVCTYDNPDSMARECWQDGELICSYQASLLMRDPFPLPPEAFFFGANIGPWETGQLHGDPKAISDRSVTVARPQQRASFPHGIGSNAEVSGSSPGRSVQKKKNNGYLS